MALSKDDRVAVRHLMAAVAKKPKGELQTYAVLYRNNEVPNKYKVQHEGTHHCYARLNAREAPRGYAAMAVVSQVRHEYCGGRMPSEAAVFAYQTWLFNRSPYRNAFITKGGKKAWKEGVLAVNCTTDRRLMGGGLVAARQVWEHPEVVSAWYDLVQLGCDEGLAFWIGHCASGVTGGEVHFGAGGYGGHKSITPCRFKPDNLRQFMAGAAKSTELSYAETNRYGQYTNMWGHPEKVYGKPYQLVEGMSYAEEGGADVVDLNPFRACLIRKVNAKTLPWKRGMERMMNTIVPKLMKELAV